MSQERAISVERGNRGQNVVVERCELTKQVSAIGLLAMLESGVVGTEARQQG